MYHDIPSELRSLIEPVLHDHGLELVDAWLSRGRGPAQLRVVVDTPVGDGAVPVEGCAAVSRELATHLEASGLVPEDYQLEVTSPGLDRVLAREKDFEAACGAEVRIETRQPRDGRRRFRGRLQAFEAGMLRLNVDGAEFEIPFHEVARASRVYEFTSADFRRGGGRGAAGARRATGMERA